MILTSTCKELVQQLVCCIFISVLQFVIYSLFGNWTIFDLSQNLAYNTRFHIIQKPWFEVKIDVYLYYAPILSQSKWALHSLCKNFTTSTPLRWVTVLFRGYTISVCNQSPRPAQPPTSAGWEMSTGQKLWSSGAGK